MVVAHGAGGVTTHAATALLRRSSYQGPVPDTGPYEPHEEEMLFNRPSQAVANLCAFLGGGRRWWQASRLASLSGRSLLRPA
jgi:hypothetical protein